jgi:meso-butanediol dehydrogenase/(S,S)-butanediol dehydrogenase/diacetyl reductase
MGQHTHRTESRKTVIVTGAAAGIGAGIAKRFAQGGYAIAIFDIDGPGATRIASELGDQTSTIAIQGDVSEEEDVRRAIETTITNFERLDVLVNNAGLEVTGSVATLTSADWDRQVAVNLRGMYLMSKYSIPRMKGRRGAIINISSVHAFVSWPECAAYDATKSGIIGLTRAMALDHGRDAIRVNAICPGYIETPLMERWLATVPDREETLAQLRRFHPLGRVGTALDVAEAAFFLASDAASFISGTYLVVDGAMTAAGH